MDIPKQYTTTALMCRKRIAVTSPIGVGKELGAYCPQYPGYCTSIHFYSQTDGAKSKDHVEIRLRTSEMKMNDSS